MPCIYNTGRFRMFSVITNIYNKKTKGHTLMDLFTVTGKLKKFFLTTRDVRCVHHGWNSTHRYDIQVLATCINMGALIFFIPAMIRVFRSARSLGNGGMNTWSLTYPQRKKSQGIMSGDLGGHSISGWSFPDTRCIQRPGNTVFRYWLTSQWKWAGLPSCWNMNVGMFCNCGICTGLVNMCPTVFL
jgi:hypothetical protein